MRISASQGLVPWMFSRIVPPDPLIVSVQFITITANSAAGQVKQFPYIKYITGRKGQLPFHFGCVRPDSVYGECGGSNGREPIRQACDQAAVFHERRKHITPRSKSLNAAVAGGKGQRQYGGETAIAHAGQPHMPAAAPVAVHNNRPNGLNLGFVLTPPADTRCTYLPKASHIAARVPGDVHLIRGYLVKSLPKSLLYPFHIVFVNVVTHHYII